MGMGAVPLLTGASAGERPLFRCGLENGLAAKKEATAAASAGEVDRGVAAERGVDWCSDIWRRGAPGEALQGMGPGLGDMGSPMLGEKTPLDGEMATPFIAAHSDARGVYG